jgi:hypothetical protein
MISVSRAGWDARPPDSTNPLNKSNVVNFIVHYSGASREQTVRSIQNFCMDTKGHVDIDYNRIVRGEFDYMGRGWNTGGHTLNNNSTSYGVCIIGVDGDATDADFRTVREIYDQVCAELGRPLTMTDHRTVLPNHTSCPGDEIHNWVAAGMPVNGGDMAAAENHLYQEQNGSIGLMHPIQIPGESPLPNPLAVALRAILSGEDAVLPAFPGPATPGTPGYVPERTWTNQLGADVHEIRSIVTEILNVINEDEEPIDIDYAQLAEALRPVIRAELAAVLNQLVVDVSVAP